MIGTEFRDVAQKLHTSRLLIRDARLDDLPSVERYSVSEAYQRHFPTEPASIEQVRRRMEFYHDSAAKTGMPFRRIWVVELMEVREIVGELTISQTSKCTAEIGWGVAEQYWSRGIGSEIARAGLQTAFDYFKIHRVEARVVPQNKHSIRILERLGFSHEGTLRECRFARGLMWSLALYGILEREFKGKPPA